MRCRLLLIFLLSLSRSLSAQNYPVQAGMTLAPPYTPDLTALAAESGRLTVTLLNKDFVTPVVDVYLSLLIEGPGITIQTKPGYVSSSVFTINAGVPLQIGGTELSDLFSPDNLEFQGLDRTAFIRSGQLLPEGLWKFSIRAYNTSRQLQVSNVAQQLVALFKHSPPMLNLPVNGAQLSSDMPQFVAFQWTPRHTISPGLSDQIQYRIRMVELMPAGRDPNEAMQAAVIPFLEFFTDQTQYTTGPADPMLVPGRSYAWQVQAIDVNGRDLFENNGFSEVHVFTWGDACQAPEGLTVSPEPGRMLAAHWDSVSTEFPSWMLWYRPVGSSEWQTSLVTRPQVVAGGLLPGRDYEVQVTRLCAFGESKPAGPLLVRTDSSKGAWNELAAKHCGKPAPVFDLSNQNPLVLLTVGDKFDAADFEVRVLSASGSNGVFSGTGTVLLPYTGKIPIPCTFEQVYINADHRMVAGKVSVLRKPLVFSNVTLDRIGDRWRDLFGTNWNLSRYQAYTGTVSGVKPAPGGGVTVSGDQGDLNLPPGRNHVIADKQGNRWYISSGGQVTGPEGQGDDPIVADERSGEGTPSSLLSMGPEVVFSRHNGNLLEWDAYAIRQQTAGTTYDRLDATDHTYYAAWKLLGTGKTEQVNATIRQGKIKISPDSVQFVRSDGTRLKSRKTSDSTWLIDVPGRLHLWADAVWAVTRIHGGGTGTPTRRILGKLNLISTDVRRVHLHLVPVNGQGGTVDVALLETSLAQMYRKFGVEPTVSLQPEMRVPGYDPVRDKPRLDQAGLQAGYPPLLAQIRDEWLGGQKMPKGDTAVMFLMGAAADDTRGYMPLSKRFGFIFCGNSPPQAHTVAHEAGHGLLVLEHPFGDDVSQARQSLNLMDYNPPHALTHWAQWKRIHDPDEVGDFMRHALQPRDKGKYIHMGADDLAPFRNPDSTITCIDPSGFLIKLPPSVTYATFSSYDRLSWLKDDNYVPRTVNIPFGALAAFSIGDKTYTCQPGSSGLMLGYLDSGKKHYYHKTYGVDSTTHLNAALTALLEPDKAGYQTLSFKIPVSGIKAQVINWYKIQPDVLGSPTVLGLADTQYSWSPDRISRHFAENGKVIRIPGRLSLTQYSRDSLYFDGKAYTVDDFIQFMLTPASSIAEQLAVMAYVFVSNEQMATLRHCVTDMRRSSLDLFGTLKRKSVKDGYITRAEYYVDALDAFLTAGSSSVLFRKIQNLLSSSAPADSFLTVFRSDLFAPCVLSALSSKERVQLINTIGVDKAYWYVNRRNILLEILNTCPAYDVEVLYNSGFRRHGYAWLRQIWDNENVLYDPQRRQVFYKYLTLFTSLEAAAKDRHTYRQALYMAEQGLTSYEHPVGIQEFYVGLDADREAYYRKQFIGGFGYGSEGALLADGRVYLAQAVEVNKYSRFGPVRSAAGVSRDFFTQYEDNYRDTLWPLEPINVVICGAHAGDGRYLDVNEVSPMPAILAYYLELERINKVKQQEFDEAVSSLVQSVVTMASVAAVPISGGSSLALTNAAVVCLDMGMAQLDETIQQTWAGMSAQERGNCSGAYSAWNTLKLAYDATTAVSVVRGGIVGLKSLVGVLRLNKSFSRFVFNGKALYDAIKSRTLSAPMGRMGARMERYVEWGRLSGAGNALFGNAREFVRTKYGQDVLNQLTLKFGAANDGAAAVILQKWGDEGLAILNKSSVKTLDDAAKELVKNKTMYRYVNENSYNFNKLKTEGLIDASPSQFPGYATLDKIDNASQAQSILQLPKKPTWVAEFSSSQIINDVRFPTGKFNNTAYKEVLTRSYPEWGVGGGSQFITNSQIKVTKLRNLTTGEVISFP